MHLPPYFAPGRNFHARRQEKEMFCRIHLQIIPETRNIEGGNFAMKKLCVILSVVVLVAAVLAGVLYVRTGNLNNDLTAVKADMENKTAELTSAKADVEAKAAEIATLTEQLTAAQGDAEAKAAEIATLTEQLTSAQNDAEAKAAEAAAHAEKAAKLSEELQVAKAEAAGLTDKMNTLSAELAAKNEEIVNLTALKEAAESKLSTLQEKLQPMIEAFDTLKQSIADDSLWQSILKPFTDAIDGLGEIFSK